MPYGPPPRQNRPSKEPRAKESRAKQSRANEPDPEAVRITVDLTQADYQLLNLWLARASLELDQPVSTMTVARGIRTLIQAAATDRAVNVVALEIMRREQP